MVRNLVFISVVAVAIGATVGVLFSEFQPTVAVPTVAVVPPGTGGTPTTTPPTPTGGGSGNNTFGRDGGGSWVTSPGTNCSVASASTQTNLFSNTIASYQPPQARTLSHTNAYDTQAAADIADMSVNNYVGTVSSTGMSLLQRLKGQFPFFSNRSQADEIIIKGCFGTNTVTDVMNTIKNSPAAAAILNNPAWSFYGVTVQNDGSTGTVYWVVIFTN